MTGATAAALPAGRPNDLTAAAKEAATAARRHLADFLTASRNGSPTDALHAYDAAVAGLIEVRNVATVMQLAHPDDRMRSTADTVCQDMDKALTELSLDSEAFVALENLDLSREDTPTRHWVDLLLRDMRRAGVDRDDDTQARVRALQEELTTTGQAFEHAIFGDTRTAEFAPHVLDGLPDDYAHAHPPEHDGLVRITTEFPDYIPFMTYCRDADARERLWRLSNQRGFPDNTSNLRKLLELRHELANLLGFSTWADFATANHSIGSADSAAVFIEQVSDAARERGDRDYAALLRYKQAEDPATDTVEPWDNLYLTDRVRSKQLAFDSQTVRPYLEFHAVRDGLMALTEHLFGIELHRSNLTTWHPDVDALDVVRDERTVGRVYLDLHPRPGKFSRAAVFPMALRKPGQLPEYALLCNLSRPVNGTALLQVTDVARFFHDFGQLLYGLTADSGRWTSASPLCVDPDLANASAQMLEEWVRDASVLASFARHQETGEPISAETVAAMRSAEEFGKGLFVRQQMYYASLSLELHRRDPASLSLDELEKELMERHTPFRHPAGARMVLSFANLGRYSAMYCAHMWSLTIAKDLFTAFDRKDLLAVEHARRFRDTVIARSASAPAMELVRDFLGRDHQLGAFQEWIDG